MELKSSSFLNEIIILPSPLLLKLVTTFDPKYFDKKEICSFVKSSNFRVVNLFFSLIIFSVCLTDKFFEMIFL